MKKVCGVGVNNVDVEKIYMLECYQVWADMLARSYSEKRQEKRPTYKGCSVCDDWLFLSNYKKWYEENYIENYNVDKDILVRGNKVYSPDTCRFVPSNINTLIINSSAKRSKYGMGVSTNKNGYKVQCSVDGELKYFGTYPTVKEAQEVSKLTKERIIKETAQTAYDNGKITEEIYNALMVWVVVI